MLKKASFLLLMTIVLWNCRRDVDQVTTDPSIKLSFSTSIVEFDTIFTTVGSTTRQLKVYNTSTEAVNISRIVLSGDNQAFFRMNVDGKSGNEITGVSLAGKDSLFIFIDVTIDPKDANLPFLVAGNIQFITNGNIQDVALVAYGQQAKFITPDKFPTNGLPAYSVVVDSLETVTWPKDTPIVIYGYAVINSYGHLIIEPGTQIYLHANSGIWVFQFGQITATGTKDLPVVFQGDRLDEYKDIAGSWDRIWINEGESGKNNTFDHVIIKNAFIGIQAEFNPFEGTKSGVSDNFLVFDNSIIENSKLAGIYATNYRILGRNSLISNAGGSNFATAGAGQYTFNQCTFANYWRGEPRSNPAIFLSHWYIDYEQSIAVPNYVFVEFNNCAIYGDQESEFNIEEELGGDTLIDFKVHHTLIKTNMDTLKYKDAFTNAIINPSNSNVFLNPYDGDFHLTSGSPALGKGDPAIVTQDNVLTIDLEENSRSSTEPDLGSYEFQ